MGWWIRPDGKWKNIPDHFEFIRAHPKDFGFKAKEAAAWTLADRTGVIETATQRGWIRVRGTRPNLSFEFWLLDGDTIANIKDFLTGEKIALDEKIMFEENSTSKNWYREAGWVLDDSILAVAANPEVARNRKRRRRS